MIWCVLAANLVAPILKFLRFGGHLQLQITIAIGRVKQVCDQLVHQRSTAVIEILFILQSLQLFPQLTESVALHR